ncbi:MAG: MogA/MoaB family molybdenum cofactor biosynthesis protein [Deltaproteobacteria bacterium]
MSGGGGHAAPPHERHAQAAPAQIACHVVTCSGSRTEADDEGGRIAREALSAAGHTVAGHEIVRDDPAELREVLIRRAPLAHARAVVITGGTGLSPTDRTLEALEPLWDKRLDGFGELFRALSFQEIGPAALLSRAAAGTIGGLLVFAVPGSPSAVRLAMERLILPTLGHAVGLAAGGHTAL